MYEKTIGSRTVFEGNIMRIEVLDVELPDGRTSTREIVRHGVAVAVIARGTDSLFSSGNSAKRSTAWSSK